MKGKVREKGKGIQRIYLTCVWMEKRWHGWVETLHKGGALFYLKRSFLFFLNESLSSSFEEIWRGNLGMLQPEV